MKKIMFFVAGLLLGLLTIPVASAVNDYICKPVDYPVYIDGVEFKSDLPLLNYNGNTYAPLRNALEASGLNVVWDDKTNTANIYTDNTALATDESGIPAAPDGSRFKKTPDGITASAEPKDELFYVSCRQFNDKYKDTSYLMHRFYSYQSILDDFGVPKDGYYLSKDGIDILKVDTGVKPSGLIEYNYYCNTVLPLIK